MSFPAFIYSNINCPFCHPCLLYINMKTSFWHTYASPKYAHILIMWKICLEDFIKLLKRPGNDIVTLTTEILSWLNEFYVGPSIFKISIKSDIVLDDK